MTAGKRSDLVVFICNDQVVFKYQGKIYPLVSYPLSCSYILNNIDRTGAKGLAIMAQNGIIKSDDSCFDIAKAVKVKTFKLL